MSTRAENGGGELPPGDGESEDTTEIKDVTTDVGAPLTVANDGPTADQSRDRDRVSGGVIRRRATLRFEDGARPTGPALEVRTPTPAGFTPEPTRTSEPTRSSAPPSSLTAESASILFDGQAAGYRLGRRLPGSDDVYHAVNPRFEGRLVIKLFRRARGLEPQVIEAFLSDTSRTSSLRHPHVVQLVDAGVLRDGTPFVVAEHLGGQTLEAALEEREGAITSGALSLVRGMASALTAAHSVGVVHLGLRPDNVFIAELAGYKVGFAKLMDFGVCHIDGAADSAANGARPRADARRSGTRAAAGPWSRWYLAPEQWRAGAAAGDARTDQFALAALAYRLMAPGRPPVGRAETGAIAGPVVLAPRVPALESVLTKALAANPAERFDSVADFFRAFEDSVSGATILAQLAPAPAGVAPLAKAAAAGSVAPAPTVAPAPPVAPRVLAAGPPSSGLAKTEEIVLPTDDAVFPSGSGDARQPRRRTHKTGERTSLTQQFFAEGERQEATRFKNARFERQPSSTSLAFESFDLVPRRRTPLWAGLFVAGALAIAGMVIWQGPRLRSSWTASELARRLGSLRTSGEPDRGARALAPGEPPASASGPPPAAAPVESPPGATEPVAGSAVVEGPPGPGPEPATGAATGPVAGAEPDPRLEAPEAPVVAPTESRPAAEATPTRSATAEAPSRISGARAPAVRRAPGDPAAEAPGPAAPSASSRAGNLPPVRNRPRPRSTALHGYIWSPQLQQMVPAQPAWPPPAESPPANAAPGPATVDPVGAPPPFDSTRPAPPALPPSTVPEPAGAGAPATAP